MRFLALLGVLLAVGAGVLRFVAGRMDVSVTTSDRNLVMTWSEGIAYASTATLGLALLVWLPSTRDRE